MFYYPSVLPWGGDFKRPTSVHCVLARQESEGEHDSAGRRVQHCEGEAWPVSLHPQLSSGQVQWGQVAW